MEFRVHRMQREGQGRRRIPSNADIDRGLSMDYLYVKPSRGIDQERPNTHRRGDHYGEYSQRTQSRSRRHSRGKEHHPHRHSMTPGYLRESSARRYSTSRGHGHGEERHLGWDSMPLEYPGNHQPRGYRRSGEYRSDYDRRAYVQGPRPPPYYSNSLHGT